MEPEHRYDLLAGGEQRGVSPLAYRHERTSRIARARRQAKTARRYPRKAA